MSTSVAERRTSIDGVSSGSTRAFQPKGSLCSEKSRCSSACVALGVERLPTLGSHTSPVRLSVIVGRAGAERIDSSTPSKSGACSETAARAGAIVKAGSARIDWFERMAAAGSTTTSVSGSASTYSATCGSVTSSSRGPRTCRCSAIERRGATSRSHAPSQAGPVASAYPSGGSDWMPSSTCCATARKEASVGSTLAPTSASEYVSSLRARRSCWPPRSLMAVCERLARSEPLAKATPGVAMITIGGETTMTLREASALAGSVTTIVSGLVIE